jgi:hypothetical protein
MLVIGDRYRDPWLSGVLSTVQLSINFVTFTDFYVYSKDGENPIVWHIKLLHKPIHLSIRWRTRHGGELTFMAHDDTDLEAK